MGGTDFRQVVYQAASQQGNHSVQLGTATHDALLERAAAMCVLGRLHMPSSAQG